MLSFSDNDNDMSFHPDTDMDMDVDPSTASGGDSEDADVMAQIDALERELEAEAKEREQKSSPDDDDESPAFKAVKECARAIINDERWTNGAIFLGHATEDQVTERYYQVWEPFHEGPPATMREVLMPVFGPAGTSELLGLRGNLSDQQLSEAICKAIQEYGDDLPRPARAWSFGPGAGDSFANDDYDDDEYGQESKQADEKYRSNEFKKKRQYLGGDASGHKAGTYVTRILGKK